MNINSIARFALLSVIAGAAASAWANSYQIVDLGQDRYVYQIGNDGLIAATNWRYDRGRPLAWRHGHWHRLNVRGYAYASDADGNIGGSHREPAIWSRDGTLHLLNLPADASTGSVIGMSNGVATGNYFPNDTPACFVGSTSGGDISDIGSLSSVVPDCSAYAINSAGQVVGYSYLDDTEARAFVWQDGVMTNLGALPGDSSSYATAIDEAGVIVGASGSNTGNFARAAMWKDGAITDLGEAKRFESTEALSINNSGDVVGDGRLAQNGLPRAVRFESGVVIDLDSEVDPIGDWSLYFAKSINDRGVIVGWGRRAGKVHGFMLIPQ